MRLETLTCVALLAVLVEVRLLVVPVSSVVVTPHILVLWEWVEEDAMEAEVEGATTVVVVMVPG